jgi:hypothetical protein
VEVVSDDFPISLRNSLSKTSEGIAS